MGGREEDVVGEGGGGLERGGGGYRDMYLGKGK